MRRELVSECAEVRLGDLADLCFKGALLLAALTLVLDTLLLEPLQRRKMDGQRRWLGGWASQYAYRSQLGRSAQARRLRVQLEPTGPLGTGRPLTESAKSRKSVLLFWRPWAPNEPAAWPVLPV